MATSAAELDQLEQQADLEAQQEHLSGEFLPADKRVISTASICAFLPEELATKYADLTLNSSDFSEEEQDLILLAYSQAYFRMIPKSSVEEIQANWSELIVATQGRKPTRWFRIRRAIANWIQPNLR